MGFLFFSPFRRLGLPLLTALALWAFVPANSAAKTVLLLHSWSPSHPRCLESREGVRQVFPFQGEVGLLEDHLYANMAAPPSGETAVALLKERYGDCEIQLVLTAGDAAFSWFLDWGDQVFPNTPMVFFGVTDVAEERFPRHSAGITGVPLTFDFRENANLAMRLFPNRKNWVWLEPGKRTDSPARQAFSATMKELDFPCNLEVYPQKVLEENPGLLDRKMAEGYVLFLAPHLGPIQGFAHSLPRWAPLRHRRNQAPVFVFWEHLVKDGYFGGWVASDIHQGRMAAQMARSILQGIPAQAVPVAQASPNHYAFNYHQLENFGISRKELPGNAVIYNVPQTFYRQHRGKILWAALVMAIQLALFIILLIFVLWRHRQFHRLTDKDRLYRQIFEQSPCGIMVEDENGNVLEANAKLCDMLGYTAGEMRGMHVQKLTPDFRENVQKRIRELAQGGFFRHDVVNLRKDGTGYPVELVEQGIRLSREKRAILVLSLGIQERLDRENQLKKNLARYQRFLEGLSLFLLIVDADMVVMDYWISRDDMFMVQPERLPGKKVTELELPGLLVEKIQQLVKEVYGQVHPPSCQVECFTPRGLQMMELRVIPLEDGRALVEIREEEKKASPPEVNTTTETVPVQKVDREEPQAPTPAPAPKAPKTSTILVVDDEEVVRTLAETILDVEGYAVLSAEDGDVAVEMVREHPEVALILLDMTMPRMSGDKALAAIREISDVPVILTSGYQEKDSSLCQEKFQTSGFLQKPFHMQDLLEMVKNLLSD